MDILLTSGMDNERRITYHDAQEKKVAVNPGDQTKPVYIGTGKRGMSLVNTFMQLAAKHTNGSLSKLLVNATIEKYGIDPSTGELTHRKTKR